MATALGLFYKKVPEFRFFLPGSEIPEWFNHQSFGSSITIERPRQYCGNRRFMGFALSAVITFNNTVVECWVSCCYSYGIYGKKSVYVGDFFSPSIESDHIAISFCPKDMTLLEGHYTTVTFNFSIYSMKSLTLQDFVKLKCCGVCPIYEEPHMPIPALVLRDFLQEVEKMSDEDDRSRAKEVEFMSYEDDRWSDEEVELHPKRNCIKQIKSSIMDCLLLSLVGLVQVVLQQAEEAGRVIVTGIVISLLAFSYEKKYF